MAHDDDFWNTWSVLNALKKGKTLMLWLIDGQAKILENEDSSTDPDVGQDAKFAFEVDITPNGGPYLGGTFRFKVHTILKLIAVWYSSMQKRL